MTVNRLTVIAGPTAVGKGTVVRWLLAQDPNIQVSVSATTREPRPGEVHGESYYFVSNEEFDHMIRDGELLEYAVVHGQNRYGTPRKPVEAALA
ncbi:MAG: guanylate kinase, partial [Microbacteriaceae bacterium]|nr:guanylate kinase [Microbacteriaceae bacterium]